MTVKSIHSGSNGNAYVVSDGATTLLIECGIPFAMLERGVDYKISKIDALLISHQHNDHSKALKDCVRAGLDCYAPQEVFDYKEVAGHRCHPVTVLRGFTVGSFFIVPFDLDHDVVNYGFMIHSKATGERLLYFTDTFQVRYRFPDVTHIMAECNHDAESIQESVDSGRIPESLKNRIAATHMSLERLTEFFGANDLSKTVQIYLVHLSKTSGKRDRYQAVVEQMTGKEVIVC